MHITQYEITVRGRLGPTLTADFAGLTATPLPTATVLSGSIADQAGLYAVLDRIDALGLELLGIRRTAVAG